MIVITGATGTLGQLVVEEALKVFPASEIGVSVRDTSKVAHLVAQGVSVREGDFYSASGQFFFFFFIKDGELRLPKDGPINWTTHEDLAQGLVAIFQDESFDQQLPVLTSARALTMEEIAQEYTQETLTRVVISDEEFYEQLNAIPNLPEEQKKCLLISSMQV